MNLFLLLAFVPSVLLAPTEVSFTQVPDVSSDGTFSTESFTDLESAKGTAFYVSYLLETLFLRDVNEILDDTKAWDADDGRLRLEILAKCKELLVQAEGFVPDICKQLD
uniref:ORF9 n=1 Tax=Alphacoronavirus PLMg1 TaxID=2520502 RepID=A0A481S090_9ALPC|nr:ORF9 [Alphacoronavirus PLMg1]